MSQTTRTTDAIDAVIPRATYRLQLHKDFDFAAASAVLPYLSRLGISHVYCSPITCARPGSLHGYDVIDHGQINPELGGREGFERFALAARALGMGLLLDQVPNHMGVFGADNAWWLDVLENGPASRFAGHFDIDWTPPNQGLAGKLLVPILGDAYGDVLERGEIRLGVDFVEGRFGLHYHHHLFPLDPRSYATVLRLATSRLHRASAVSCGLLLRLADAFEALPDRNLADAVQRGARRQGQRELQQGLKQAAAADAGLAEAVLAAVDRFNAPTERDALDALHESQAYRLAHWRMAADEINYRRFFDVNALAALRIEDEAVFEAVQGPALDLAAAGWVDGFRIDHPDGLLDPASYFARLQEGYARRVGLALPEAHAGTSRGVERPSCPLYVVAEKIAAAHEDVPTTWALHGTTGYRFATVVNGLFVERRHAARMERLWRSHTGSDVDYADLVHACKRRIALHALSSQLMVLTQALQAIALADRRTRDHGFNTLREALAEVAAAMPVYRTYVDGSASAQDRRFIDWAIAQARRRSEAIDPSLFDFIRRCLLCEVTAPGMAEPVRQFALRFQQFCAPVAAKGVEDTAFYRYHRLVSLSEVGGDPGAFGTSAGTFHRASADRAARWPHTMLTTSTHDNKRSEDVRNRINVLSEQPAAWRLALRRWKAATRHWQSLVDGREAPSVADQYLLHQTLLGSLPPEGLNEAGAGDYRERIAQFMRKAARESKAFTNWDRPNLAYEAALSDFVRRLLERVDGNAALTELQAHAREIAWFGALNSLSTTVLKYTSPGVPDLYQGTELIDLSLVDPDNRRPVDYARRASLLSELESLDADRPELGALTASPTDGRLKLWAIWRLLSLRKQAPALFEASDYLPLKVSGLRRHHVVAFARRQAGATLVVVVARKFARLQRAGLWPAGPGLWGDTRVEGAAWLADGAGRDTLCRSLCAVRDGSVALAEAFDTLPFAAIHFESIGPVAQRWKR